MKVVGPQTPNPFRRTMHENIFSVSKVIIPAANVTIISYYSILHIDIIKAQMRYVIFFLFYESEILATLGTLSKNYSKAQAF